METAFYQTFKRKDSTDEAIYRAIQVKSQEEDEIRKIKDLCIGVVKSMKHDTEIITGDWIVENPHKTDKDGGITYQFYNATSFDKYFEHVEVDPWILSGGRDLSICSTQN